jgi:hypothetical protein
MEINYLLGRRKHFLELGGGAVLNTVTSILPTASLGYRYFPRKSFSCRAGLAFPLLAQASIGWTF